jgi:Ras-related protein Rab-5C
MPKTIEPITIKIAILGDGNVGKTSLVNRFLKDTFPKKYIPTIGSIILKKDYKLKDVVIKVNIWDLGGQRSFNPLNPSFYTNVDAAYLVFDLTKPEETLNDVKTVYLKNLEKFAKDCQVILAGNKLDLISIEKDLKGIKKYLTEDVPLVITSAKNGENVADTFELLIYSYLEEWEHDHEGDEGIAEKFLESIGKDETYLLSQFVNFDDIKSIAVQKPAKKVPPKSKPAKKASTTKKKPAVTQKPRESVIDYYIPIKEELEKKDLANDTIIEEFNNNLTKVENLVLKLKTVPIDSLVHSIDNTKQQITNIKEDFNLTLKTFMKSLNTSREVKKKKLNK